MLKGKNILIGVTSGISIYKILSLISKLKKLGANVEVIMTESATKFINPITFETMSGNPVYTDMWVHPDKVLHVDITNDKDLFLIAPATVNTIAKINAGIGDNLLTTTVLASKVPVVMAIAANTVMLENPITQKNIASLKSYGYEFIDSNVGMLACNTVGNGRMAEVDEIIDFLEYKLATKDLLGKKIIVTAGASISRLDPVRFITNDSSGKMGYELAKNARNRGAEVVYITGRVNTPEIKKVKHIKYNTNIELKNAIKSEFENCDYLIMAAAPVDYEFIETSNQKIKKSDEIVNYKMGKSEDILRYFGSIKTSQKIIGFAAETENLLDNAYKKLKSKNLDYIIANDVSLPDAGFNVDTNIITILNEKNKKEYPKMNKSKVAKVILDELVK